MQKRKFLGILAGAALSLAIFVGCSAQESDTTSNSSEANDQQIVRYLNIQGSDTMVNMGQALAEVYMNDVNSNASISVTGGGSGTGIAALLNNNADIAQSSRSIKQEEVDAAKENGVNVYEFTVAQDGLAVMLHKDNPINQLTLPQIKEVFTGKITNWAELGWEDGGDITLYSRQSNSGTYVFFNENVMDGEDWAEGTMFMSGSAAIAEGITNDVSGIGYSGVGYVKEGIKAAMVARTLNDEYVSPMKKEDVDSGKYPITRPLFFYTNGKPEGEQLAYLQWVLGEGGQVVVGETGYYSYTPEQRMKNDEVFESLGL